MVIKMSNDKILYVTKTTNTFQGENNAEILKIFLPRVLNGVDLLACFVWLNWKNQDEVGQVSDITGLIREYNDDYYVAEIPVSSTFTYKSGQIELWLKIVNAATEMVAKTNIVKYEIIPHIEVEDIMPEQDLSLLDRLATDLANTMEDVQDIDEYVDELKQGEVFVVEPDDEEESEE